MTSTDPNATTYPVGQHPSMPPPATERGLVKWLKNQPPLIRGTIPLPPLLVSIFYI